MAVVQRNTCMVALARAAAPPQCLQDVQAALFALPHGRAWDAEGKARKPLVMLR